MRIILLLIVFYFPSWVFAGICGLPPAPPCFPGGGGIISPEALSADLSNVGALQSAYNLQTFTMINGLNYDCSVFNARGICISPGTRYTTSNGTSSDTTGVLLIGAYKVNKNIRLGAWVDKSLSTNMQGGVNLSSSNPFYGVFGVWSEKENGTGFDVRVAAGSGNNNMTITRTAAGTSEAGVGTTGLNSQAISGMLKYGLAITPNWIASPYAGVRYITIKTGAYMETQSSTVTTPLTYDALSHNATTALVGVRLMTNITPVTTLQASVGLEQDLHNGGNVYNATGVGEINPIVFNANIQKTRPAASVGAYYDINKTQRIGLDTYYRQEAFQSTPAMSVLITYQAGF